jgi:alkylation response protein AidB-like acyl-CoA dehydrogenase
MADVVIDAGPVERARALAPAIEAAIPRIDAECCLPPDLHAALRDAGMYRLLVPQSCGGAELDLMTYAATLEAIAMVDASTAWVLGQLNGCGMSAAYLELDVAREMFGVPEGILAWGPPLPDTKARGDVVDGGYRVTASWQFASGSRQASWLGGSVPVFEADGSPRKTPGGTTESRMMLFPKSSATITDVWRVIGLRGTGSDQYAISELFVPAERTFIRERVATRETGPLYRVSTIYSHAVAFAAVALGIARTMLDAFVDLAKTKTPRRGGTDGGLRENAAVQARIGEAESRLRAARAYLLAAAERGHREASTMTTGAIGIESRIDMRCASTFAIGAAEEVADLAYRMAGSTAIFDTQPFERRLRDMHAVTQQAQAHLSNYESVGQYRLDVPMKLMI